MARQTGTTFVGRVGQLSFYHDKVHGYLVRTAGGPTKEQIKKGKNFGSVRNNNTAFGQASAYNRLLRGAFVPLLSIASDYYTSRRLQAQLYSVLKTAQANGTRIAYELAKAFVSFELLNTTAFLPLFGSLPALELTGKTAHLNGRLKPSRKSFVGCTHLQWTSCVAVVSPDWKRIVRDVQPGPLVKLGATINLAQSHTVQGEGHLFYGLAVQCFREEKGSITLEKGGPHCGFLAYGGMVD